MSTNRLQTIKKLIELADIELDKSAQFYGYVQQKQSLAEQQLSELQAYLKDYDQQAQTSAQRSVAHLRSRHLFAGKLTEAVQAQQVQLKDADRMLAEAHQAWIDKRVKSKSLHALYERLQKNEHTRLNKLEQKLLDELSSHKYHPAHQTDQHLP